MGNISGVVGQIVTGYLNGSFSLWGKTECVALAKRDMLNETTIGQCDALLWYENSSSCPCFSILISMLAKL